MKVILVLDGERHEVVVDLGAGVARIGERTYPVRVVSVLANSTDVEIAGERVRVDGWPAAAELSPSTVNVDGERVDVRVELRPEGRTPPGPAPRPAVPPSGAGGPLPRTGTNDILPPMPGKVIEVRVREGERVRKGAVLLVLEAMKMRNEVLAPRDGVVRRLQVSDGLTVRARVPMLAVVPEPTEGEAPGA